MRHRHGFSLPRHFSPGSGAVNGVVRDAAVGGLPAAGGRIMKGRETRKARSRGAGCPGRCRQGPGGHCTGGAETVGRAFRAGARPCDGAWRGAPNRGRVRRRGLCGAGCAGSGGFGPKTTVGTIGCRAPRALRDGSVRKRLARDNCCYREPISQLCHSRRPARRPPARSAAILGPSKTQFNLLVRRRLLRAEVPAPRHPRPAHPETAPAPRGGLGSR